MLLSIQISICANHVVFNEELTNLRVQHSITHNLITTIPNFFCCDALGVEGFGTKNLLCNPERKSDNFPPEIVFWCNCSSNISSDDLWLLGLLRVHYLLKTTIIMEWNYFPSHHEPIMHFELHGVWLVLARGWCSLTDVLKVHQIQYLYQSNKTCLLT